VVYPFLCPLSTLKLTFLLGVNIFSTVACIARPMRASRAALLPIQSSKLDSSCCRSMGITLRTTVSKQGTSDQERRNYLKTMQVHLLYNFEFHAYTLLQWFPMEYYGNEDQGGVNGHFYHVFNTVGSTSKILTQMKLNTIHSHCIMPFLQVPLCSPYVTIDIEKKKYITFTKKAREKTINQLEILRYTER